MYFLDELQDMKLYRRRVLLPIDDKDKNHGSLAYILSPKQVDGLLDIMNSNILIPRYFRGYYMERAVMYYINHENEFEEFPEEELITETSLYDESNPKVSVTEKCLSYPGAGHKNFTFSNCPQGFSPAVPNTTSLII